jgi:predicted dehydrogenase
LARFPTHPPPTSKPCTPSDTAPATIRDHRLYAPGRPGHDGWAEIPGIRPDSSDVSHHPFHAQANHFIDCLTRGVESHCNLADAAKTHEIFLAALECYRTGRPVTLPL